MLLNFLIMLIFMFLSIAFFTIMERKILGIFHVRLGPNKVGMMGILQPFSDATKLFSKMIYMISKINTMVWNLSPLFIFMFLMLILNFVPLKMENNSFFLNLAMLMFILGIPIFFMIFSSFFSFSKFSVISSKRVITQTLSYEMGLMFIIILMMPLLCKTNINEISNLMNSISMYKIMLVFMFFLIILAESSRIPFDFIESESELVSGFNTEFSSSYFSLFFIFEYGMMLFFSIFMSMMFFFFFFFMVLIYLFIQIRASFPRLRYDQMMMFFWKMFFPMMISMMIMKKML